MDTEFQIDRVRRSGMMAAILIASLDERRVGLRVEDVVEVVWAVSLTPLPGSPPVVEGLMDLRGLLVPVLDVRPRFGLTRRSPLLSDRLVLVRGGERVIALRFDGAEGVVDVEDDMIAAPASFGPTSSGIAGVAKLPDGLVLIHQLDSFLSETESALLEEALSDREGGASE